MEAEWFAADQLPAELLWGLRDRIFDALAGGGGSVEKVGEAGEIAVRTLALTASAQELGSPEQTECV